MAGRNHLATTSTAARPNQINEPKQNKFSNREMFENLMRGIYNGVSEVMRSKFDNILNLAGLLGIEKAVKSRNETYLSTNNKFSGNQVNRTDADTSELAQYVQKGEIEAKDIEKLFRADEILIRKNSDSADSSLHALVLFIKERGVSKLKELSVNDLVAIGSDIIDHSPEFCPKIMSRTGKRRLKEGAYDAIKTMKDARMDLERKETGQLDAVQNAIAIEINLQSTAAELQKFDDQPGLPFAGISLVPNQNTGYQDIPAPSDRRDMDSPQLRLIVNNVANSQENEQNMRRTIGQEVQMRTLTSSLIVNRGADRLQPLTEGIVANERRKMPETKTTQAKNNQDVPRILHLVKSAEKIESKLKGNDERTVEAKTKPIPPKAGQSETEDGKPESKSGKNGKTKNRKKRIRNHVAKKAEKIKKDKEREHTEKEGRKETKKIKTQKKLKKNEKKAEKEAKARKEPKTKGKAKENRMSETKKNPSGEKKKKQNALEKPKLQERKLFGEKVSSKRKENSGKTGKAAKKQPGASLKKRKLAAALRKQRREKAKNAKAAEKKAAQCKRKKQQKKKPEITAKKPAKLPGKQKRGGKKIHPLILAEILRPRKARRRKAKLAA